MGKKKKAKKLTQKKKRILYPWLKKKQGKMYKVMLAIYADQKGFSNVINGKVSFGKFLENINTKVDKIFPTMFLSVKKYYKARGRVIDKKEFRRISIGRIRMMFKYNPDKNKVKRLKEHPINDPKRFKKNIVVCEKIIKSKLTYDEYIAKRKK